MSSKSIYLANITVLKSIKTIRKEQKITTFKDVSFVDGKEYYKGYKILNVEKIKVIGKTNYSQ